MIIDHIAPLTKCEVSTTYNSKRSGVFILRIRFQDRFSEPISVSAIGGHGGGAVERCRMFLSRRPVK